MWLLDACLLFFWLVHKENCVTFTLPFLDFICHFNSRKRNVEKEVFSFFSSPFVFSLNLKNTINLYAIPCISFTFWDFFLFDKLSFLCKLKTVADWVWFTIQTVSFTLGCVKLMVLVNALYYVLKLKSSLRFKSQKNYTHYLSGITIGSEIGVIFFLMHFYLALKKDLCMPMS